MTDGYSGPATLRTGDGHTFDVEATVATHIDDYQIHSWEGRAATNDLRAMRVLAGQDATLDLPNGQRGDVHIVHVGLGESGVLLRLHGSGPAPY